MFGAGPKYVLAMYPRVQEGPRVLTMLHENWYQLRNACCIPKLPPAQPVRMLCLLNITSDSYSVDNDLDLCNAQLWVIQTASFTQRRSQ